MASDSYNIETLVESIDGHIVMGGYYEDADGDTNGLIHLVDASKGNMKSLYEMQTATSVTNMLAVEPGSSGGGGFSSANEMVLAFTRSEFGLYVYNIVNEYLTFSVGYVFTDQDTNYAGSEDTLFC
jgi:hypothetical protein